MVGMLEIVVIVFCLFALSRVVLRWKDGQVSWREAAFWTAIWLAVIAAVFLQSQLRILGNLIDSRRPVDVLMYIIILLLFYLIFRMYVKLDRLGADITTLVRNQALGRRKR